MMYVSRRKSQQLKQNVSSIRILSIFFFFFWDVCLSCCVVRDQFTWSRCSSVPVPICTASLFFSKSITHGNNRCAFAADVFSSASTENFVAVLTSEIGQAVSSLDAYGQIC